MSSWRGKASSADRVVFWVKPCHTPAIFDRKCLRMNTPSTAPVESDWEIASGPHSVAQGLSGIWSQRRLIPLLAKLSVKMAYQKAFFGMAWLFARPFIMALGATVVFRDALNIQTGVLPYPLFFLASLAVWIVFQRGIAWCTRGPNRYARIVTRYPVSRLMIVAICITPALVEGGTVFVCFLLAIGIYWMVDGVLFLEVSWKLLAIFPIFIFVMLLIWSITLFTGLWFIKVRDIWYAMRYGLTGLMFASPIYYPLSAVPAAYRDAMLLNPITSAVMAYRWALFGGDQPNLSALSAHIIFVGLVVIAGLRYFERKNGSVFDHL